MNNFKFMVITEEALHDLIVTLNRGNISNFRIENGYLVADMTTIRNNESYVYYGFSIPIHNDIEKIKQLVDQYESDHHD